MKADTVYKVVATFGDGWFSPVAYRYAGLSCQYRLNHVTQAPIRERTTLPLLAFAQLDDAICFIREPENLLILECSANHVIPIDRVSLYLSGAVSFWKGTPGPTTQAPPSTVACSSIRPIRIVGRLPKDRTTGPEINPSWGGYPVIDTRLP